MKTENSRKTKSAKKIEKLIAHIQATKKNVIVEIIENNEMGYNKSLTYKRIYNVIIVADYNTKVEINFFEYLNEDKYNFNIKAYETMHIRNIFTSLCNPSYKFIKHTIDEIDFLLHIYMNFEYDKQETI